MDYILSLDQGTTSSRALLVDRHGKITGVAQKEFKQHFPKSGWVEHDAAEIWFSEAAVMAEVIAKTKVKAKEIKAIGITNQRETTVVWDRKTGKPIHNAIVWQDRRTADYCSKLKKEGVESTIIEKTGLVLDPYFSGTKIRWILDNIQGAKEKANRGELAFGTIETWLLWNLTAGKCHMSDVSNASRTLLFNIHTLDWDDELLKIFGVPRSMLPEIRGNSEVYGQTHMELFHSPIPIAAMAGDQQSSMFGHACFEKGMIKTTYGTGAFSLLNTGNEIVHSKNKLLSTVAWQIKDEVTYALEGSVFMAGASIQWLRDGLNLINDAKEADVEAAKVKDNGGVYLVPAFTGLGAPHWDPRARGTLLGLSRGTTKGHICLATLEGIAFQVHDVIHSMLQDAKMSGSIMRVDGGVTLSKILMQFQADLLQMNIGKPASQETTALGASYLAGLAVGIWKDLDEISNLWKLTDEYKPKKPPEHIEYPLKKWKRAIECTKHWEME
ncbi:MAG: glycerol kinase GlpK [Rhabdochlamydiaceae bacterium]|nr:glycerol kinase GlpK [Candidatus Amphrikana amoebophyrae]